MSEKSDAKEKFFELIFDNKMIIIGLVIFTITPGVWTIFFFNREEFWKMDVIKLLLISISICMPVFSCCFLILFGCLVQGRMELDYSLIIMASILYTVVVFTIVIFGKILYSDMTVKCAMLVIIGLLLLFGVVNGYRVWDIRIRKRKGSI